MGYIKGVAIHQVTHVKYKVYTHHLSVIRTVVKNIVVKNVLLSCLDISLVPLAAPPG